MDIYSWQCPDPSCTATSLIETDEKVSDAIRVIIHEIVKNQTRHLSKPNILIALNNYKHNVISFIISYFLLKILSHFILINQWQPLTHLTSLTKQGISKISSISDEYCICSVMEVDETVKEVNSYDKSLPNSDKSQLKNSFCENAMHSSTTSEKQIMKGSECFQFNNSVIQSNGVPVKIKEEIDDDNRNNFTQNGDIKCHNNVEPLDLVHSLENNKKLNCSNIKDRPNGSSEDVITNSIKCEAKDKSNSLQNHEVSLNS